MKRVTRRRFIQASAAITFGAPAILSARSPNDRIRLAGIGVGGKGWSDINGAASYGDVVAFCDVDSGANRRGGFAAAAERWPAASRYTDWRKLLDREHANVDAVTISTPDHMHAPITLAAMERGLAVYTQKPLTRTVHEARSLAEAAKRAGVATQMGNQHHSGRGYRTLVEIVRKGLIGKVREAHAWSNRPIWPQGIDRPAGADPVPETLAWDLWLGVAPERPYRKDAYHPFAWRGWYDFGAGALGDMGCHIIDPVVWSLELGPPASVSYEGPTPHPESFPAWEILRYRFPATPHTAGELSMTWWDGGKRPRAAGSHVPDESELPAQGVMLIGEIGTLLCAHGQHPELFPRAEFADVQLPDVAGEDHYEVWLNGLRTGSTSSPSSSDFSYAGPLTETVLLGVIASRVGTGELAWNSKELAFANSEIANRFVREDYRQGW